MSALRIGIVGDFDRGKHSHWATEAALFHAGARRLQQFDGIWGAPGSPYESMTGILGAIQYAREHDMVYLGTCAGFQYALIEFSRNVLGLVDADSAENGPRAENIVITPVHCATPSLSPRSPRLVGGGVVRPLPGTLLESLCGSRTFVEEYFCSFETNPDFVSRWEDAGLCAAAIGENSEMRALEIRGRRFFLATLFQPQLSSSRERPHPIVEGYLRACMKPQQ